MKLTFGLLSLISIIAAIPARATVTLNFNAPFTGGVSSNFADYQGTVTNGLVWGILVDPTGTDTFPPIFGHLGLIPGATTTLENGNILILSAVGTSNTSIFLEGDAVTPGGDGGVGSLTSIPLSQTTAGVSPGDQFRLIWFDPSGLLYGFVSSPIFTIPSDGSNVDYATLFVGIDPVRPANIPMTPEPAAPLLSALGLAGFLIRRRR